MECNSCESLFKTAKEIDRLNRDRAFLEKRLEHFRESNRYLEGELNRARNLIKEIDRHGWPVCGCGKRMRIVDWEEFDLSPVRSVRLVCECTHPEE